MLLGCIRIRSHPSSAQFRSQQPPDMIADARWLLLQLICILQGVLRGGADENEYRLTRHLLGNYDASVRPVENSSLPLKITFGISLHHIIDVDEKNQILTTNCWLTYIWVDHHLKWNVSDFAGIKVVRIPYHRVWRPDVILYNNADSQYGNAVINTNVIVSSTGEVVWLSHGIYRSSCDINVEYFPFDIQSCRMKWASWTYDGYQVDLVKQTEHGDVSNYQPNGEFDLVSFEAERHVVIYSCCPEPYPDITYTIRIRRRPLFYVFNLILPCLLINSIALLVFYVPSESGEKVTLGISALLSMTVFLMTIRESLPPTEKTPLISMYYGVSICLVSFASGLSVVTLNVHHRGVRGSGVPTLLRKLVLGPLARVAFVHFDPNEGQPIQQPPPPAKYKPQDGSSRAELRRDRLVDRWANLSPDSDRERSNSDFSPERSPRLVPRGQRRDSNQDSLEGQFLRALHKINAAIERNEARVQESERRESVCREWKQVALVCDRVLLWAFILTTAVTTTAILFSSPHGP